MVWKVVNISDTGTASKFGADDTDKINKGFSGIDVDDYDLNSDWTFRDGKLQVGNPANTFKYNFRSSALAANRDITLPLLTAGDTFTFNNFAATLANKTLDSTCVVNTAALPSDVVKEGIANDFGDFDNSFKDNRIRIWNPADTFRYTLVAAAISGNRNLNLPLTTGTDTLVALGVANDYGDFDNSFRDNRLRLWNPADTFRYTIIAAAIGADRNLTLPLLTGNDTAVAEAHTATLTNKTINTGGYANSTGNIVQGSSIANPYQGAGTSATLKRTGLFTATSSNAGEGLFNNSLTAIGTHTRVNDTTEGLVGQYATTAVANANAGLRQTVAFYRREWGSYFILRLKLSSTSDIRAFIGWSSDGSEIAGETTLNNFSGCGIGRRAADTNWFTYRNDGDATEDRTDTTIATGTTWLTVEMRINSTDFKVKIGGTEFTETTELPAAATDLMFHCQIETGAGGADKNIQIAPIWSSTGF